MLHPVYTLHTTQWVPRDLHDVFAFFERPGNLPRITPPWLGFRILTAEPIVMAAGLTIDYRVRVMGVPTRWRSLISEYDPPHAFRDVQLAGPYRRWDHHHRFRTESGGTTIEDLVVYEPPCGPLGMLVHRLAIRHQLAAIFQYRRDRIAALLGADPAGVGDAAPRSAAPLPGADAAGAKRLARTRAVDTTRCAPRSTTASCSRGA
jgi:ligand-binding SRPBCC domain-containing protein